MSSINGEISIGKCLPFPIWDCRNRAIVMWLVCWQNIAMMYLRFLDLWMGRIDKVLKLTFRLSRSAKGSLPSIPKLSHWCFLHINLRTLFSIKSPCLKCLILSWRIFKPSRVLLQFVYRSSLTKMSNFCPTMNKLYMKIAISSLFLMLSSIKIYFLQSLTGSHFKNSSKMRGRFLIQFKSFLICSTKSITCRAFMERMNLQRK